MNQELIQAMNEQINLEMYSGYLYLSLSIQMEKMNYKGYAKWLESHYEEEFAHAKDFIHFMQKRNTSATLEDIKAQPCESTEPIEIAKLVLAHEKKVTMQIDKLHDVAKKNNDYATEIFMHQYIQEQIEEECLAQDIIDKFNFAGDSVSAKYSVDRELASL